MHFAPDDMQNMYTYWNRGAWGVIKANLLVATSFYRPLAGLFYLPIFQLFGLNPLPYRIAIYAMLLLNIGLLYGLARQLTASRETAAFATLIGCFHSTAVLVYVSTAMIYEVLCYAFLLGALWWYVRIRSQGRALSVRELLIFALLFACALNSKEMAVVLPAMLVGYEIVYRGLRRPSLRELIPIALAGMMSAVYLGGKLFGAETLTNIAAYRPEYSVDRYLETASRYAADVLMHKEPLSDALTVAFWLVLFGIAAVLRRRNMWFGAAFAFLAYLPLNFVQPRQGFVLYIPLAGFSIYAADLLVALLDLLRLRVEYRKQIGALAFVGLLVALSLVNARSAEDFSSIRHAQRMTWHVLEEFKRIHPHAKPGSRLLLVDSPIDNSWDLYFIANLYFNDKSVKMAWTRPQKGDPIIYGDAHENFDHELRYQGEQLVQTR